MALVSAYYLVKKNGAWYRPNAAGYTKDLAKAGVFDHKEAVSHSRAQGVTIHGWDEIRTEIDQEIAELRLKIGTLNRIETQLLGLRGDGE